MKTLLAFVFFISAMCIYKTSSAQIDLNNLDIKDIIGRVMNVKRGFAPKFALGDISIPKIAKVAEILGLKKNDQVNRLFSTFRTGRAVYKVTSYVGPALALYGAIKAASRTAGDSLTSGHYQTAITSGLVTLGSGLLVKFLTKAASYKAVDIFNGIAARKIRDIFSIKPASRTMGIGLYVKL